MTLVPVILSGGAGTRLWPSSRRQLPKPFFEIGGSSLLAQTVERATRLSKVKPLIVTGEDHLHLSQRVLPVACDYILEPMGRNTAPAIAIAAMQCLDTYGADAVMMVMPADHIIHNGDAFAADVKAAEGVARQDQLVVFGIPPTQPDTGYGYIEVDQIGQPVQSVKRFVEKPDLETAKSYLASGRYYWNSGMFCFTAATFLAALEQHAPEIWEPARRCFEARQAGEITRFDADLFAAQMNISIDYALMERAANISVIAANFVWSDVGTWDAAAATLQPDADGNTRDGLHPVMMLDSRNSHVAALSDHPRLVATLGVDDLVVVDTQDALLVATKDTVKNVKDLVHILSEAPAGSFAKNLTEQAATVSRPWGSYTSLLVAPGCQVKSICVLPGQRLSLQYHHQRAEHWVVREGEGEVQIEETVYAARAGDYFFIPKAAQHRLSNTGAETLYLVEVQIGDYLGEDDIVRLDDIYGRSPVADGTPKA